MPKIGHRPKSTDVIERAAVDFGSKTVTRLAKLSRDERAMRLAAFKKIVDRVESRATASGRPETRATRVATRGR